MSVDGNAVVRPPATASVTDHARAVVVTTVGVAAVGSVGVPDGALAHSCGNAAVSAAVTGTVNSHVHPAVVLVVGGVAGVWDNPSDHALL
ncbi:hypothetical protein LT337_31925 (plasmid) [Mycolicibacterium fortuitum]|uniref:hypothetical protein n=1 Tax=Mycolicibacterium conceptionense TaxID=451644 RepID=UPI003204FC36|nr:hypothetical protein LT337_31925 [Mycolicibacterium fortuitum]